MNINLSINTDNNITKKIIKANSNRYRREPWMTDEILGDIRRRDRLAKLPGRRADYKKLRNSIVSKIRKLERSYLKKQVEDSMGDIKKHWNVLKTITGKINNKTESATAFYYNGLLNSDPQNNADNMNTYFAKIGKETNESVGASKTNSADYLKKHTKPNDHELLLTDVSSADIIEACQKFTPKTSCDATSMQQNIISRYIPKMY